MDLISTSGSSSHTCLLALPWTQTLSCPRAFALEAPLPGEILLQTSSWTLPHVLHIFTQRSLSQWGPLSTFPVPTHLHAGSKCSEHLPTSKGNTSLLTSLLVHTLPLPPRTHRTWLKRFVCGSLSSPRCKKRVSCLCHTTNISLRNDQCKALPYSRYSVFIDVTSGHMLSCGSYSTTSIRTDLNAACILLTKADLPSPQTNQPAHHKQASLSLQKGRSFTSRSYIQLAVILLGSAF